MLKKKILVVGDCSQNRSAFDRAFPLFDLFFVLTGNEASEKIKNNNFSLIFVDYHITPTQDGLEVLREINFQTKNQIPSILIIDEGLEKISVAAMHEGISDYLTRNELVPSILRMTATRAIERKKWERVHHDLSQEDPYLRDPKTLLFNKGYFETRLSEEIERSKRYQFPLSLSVFTVDELDHIRNEYGDDRCNDVLKELCKMFQRNIRSSDIIARVDDYQMAVLLPHTTLDETKSFWQRMLQLFSEQAFSINGKQFFLTLKIAISPMNKEIEKMETFLKEINSFLDKQTSTNEPLLLHMED